MTSTARSVSKAAVQQTGEQRTCAKKFRRKFASLMVQISYHFWDNTIESTG